MNTDKTILNVGLPKGSLNQKGRGETWKLLTEAQYDIIGYEPGNEDSGNLAIANDSELELYLIRPQSIGLEMVDYGLIDVAIMGSDWAEEWKSSGKQLELLANLGYGKARVVLAADGRLASCYDRPLAMGDIFENYVPAKGFTEFPKLTEQYLLRCPDYIKRFGNDKPSIYFRGAKIQRGRVETQLIISEGLTESNLLKKLAGFIVDVVQTGKTLEQNGAVVLDTILETEAGLYASPRINKIPSVKAKAEEFKEMLVSVVNARGRRFYSLNLPADSLSAFVNWIDANGYSTKEPTVSLFGENASVSVLVQQSQIPEFLSGARKYGASDVVSFDIQQVFGLSEGN